MDGRTDNTLSNATNDASRNENVFRHDLVRRRKGEEVNEVRTITIIASQNASRKIFRTEYGLDAQPHADLVVWFPPYPAYLFEGKKTQYVGTGIPL